MSSRLPGSAHVTRPWRIHEIAPDFRVEDVWALDTPGGPDGLARLADQFTAGPDNVIVRALLAIRLKLGKPLGMNPPTTGTGVSSLRERLPDDLRDRPGPDLGPYACLFLTDTEWAAHATTGGVDAIAHLGWVPDDTGGYRGQWTTLVKTHSWFGKTYMAGIAPIRHHVVYPLMVRSIARNWRTSDPQALRTTS
ncbi:DUF2867 domain-containing protein [Actinokineospora xionganensis]|uniref:DUF2867 domain-containing protein n=1 Tax=Actinokineospora xionganensis TaxID=2684470 RepID=A0ABR7L021_9PSEU|nr:DUF2867 domain-containing protein [Actinokineospora xionganensis]MBC6446021.1 DUF2867 domain-containing protein [Actinokineospora xionganensis]